ncbi:MAG: hypothetical protein ACRDF4_09090 [Rhabdochlamydiaceae bacterium]
MSLELNKLVDLKSYVEGYLGVPVFYQRSERKFSIRAGHASWRGEVDSDKKADELQAWLNEHSAKETKGYIEDQVLFQK